MNYGSIGWYVLGYFGMGIVVWLLGSIVIGIAAAVADCRWDMEHDPDMNRTDTLDALTDFCDSVTEDVVTQCNAADNPRAEFGLSAFKTLLLWPYSLPKAFTIVWTNAVELRDRRR